MLFRSTAPGHGSEPQEIDALKADIAALKSEQHDDKVRKSVWLAQGKVLLAIGGLIGSATATGVMYLLGMM